MSLPVLGQNHRLPESIQEGEHILDSLGLGMGFDGIRNARCQFYSQLERWESQ